MSVYHRFCLQFVILFVLNMRNGAYCCIPAWILTPTNVYLNSPLLLGVIQISHCSVVGPKYWAICFTLEEVGEYCAYSCPSQEKSFVGNLQGGLLCSKFSSAAGLTGYCALIVC